VEGVHSGSAAISGYFIMLQSQHQAPKRGFGTAPGSSYGRLKSPLLRHDGDKKQFVVSRWDAEIAVEEEYQIARQRGTAQTLELFVARHPDSPLADKACADLRRTPR
jgi:hypothetical protein